MFERGWDELDFVYVSGDAYVDHPSFGMAIITPAARGPRLPRSASSRSPIGAIRRPLPRSANRAWASSSRPATWTRWSTTSRSRRSAAARTRIRPAARLVCAPITPAVVYGNLIRRTYKKTPVILGGIEASLRRLAHYDYWSDSLKRSDPARLGRRPHLLRHGRAFHHRDCGRPGQRPLRP